MNKYSFIEEVQILKIFDSIKKEEDDYVENIISFGSRNFPISYMFGVFNGMFHDKNTDLVNILIPYIITNIKNIEFSTIILNAVNLSFESNISELLGRIKKRNYEHKIAYDEHIINNITDRVIANIDSLELSKITILRDIQKNISIKKVLNFYDIEFEDIYSKDINFADIWYKNNYAFFKILDCLFEQYKLILSPQIEYKKPNKLENIYNDFKINISKIDNEFDTWQLLSLNSNFSIRETLPAKIYDSRINSVLYPTLINLDFLKMIKERIRKNEIINFAFRPNYYDISENIRDYDIALESVDFGYPFDLEIIHVPIVTKMINNENDSLWIKITQNYEITFEELLDNTTYEGDFIRTRMVHLVYFVEKGKYFIKHIDFEYIYYSLDEYIPRLKNVNKKGIEKKRCKIFKIDNSKIPLFQDIKSDFLLSILNTFFSKKELLNEYFNNMTTNGLVKEI